MASSDPELRAQIVADLMLDENELGFLIGKKADSKEVKAAIASAEEIIEARRTVRKTAPVSEPSRIDPPISVPEPVSEAVPAPVAPAKPKAQRSLFDF